MDRAVATKSAAAPRALPCTASICGLTLAKSAPPMPRGVPLGSASAAWVGGPLGSGPRAVAMCTDELASSSRRCSNSLAPEDCSATAMAASNAAACKHFSLGRWLFMPDA